MGIGQTQQPTGLLAFQNNVRRAPPPPPPPLFGANLAGQPRIDFNALPRTQVPQAEPYQRPQPPSALQQGITSSLSGLAGLQQYSGGMFGET